MLDDTNLTKDAHHMLVALYSSYRAKIAEGKSRRDAVIFGGAKDLHKTYFKNEHLADVEDWVRELHRNGFIDVPIYADGSPKIVIIKSETIAYMEKLPENKLKQYLDTVGGIINFFG